MGHVMDQITGVLPARAAVRVSQLVGRAGGGSKVKSFAHEHHRSPADRLAGLRGGRRWLRRARGSSNKLMLLMCGPWSMFLTFPLQVLLRLLRKPEYGQGVVEQNRGAVVGRVGQTPNVASQRKRAGTHWKGTAKQIKYVPFIQSGRRTDATTITAPLSANRTKELSRGSNSALMSIGHLKEEARSGGVD